MDMMPEENLQRLGGDKELALDMTPVEHLDLGCPPTLMLWGDQDEFRPGMEAFVARARERGISVETMVAEGAGHGFFNRPPWLERTTRRLEEFFQGLGWLGLRADGQISGNGEQ